MSAFLLASAHSCKMVSRSGSRYFLLKRQLALKRLQARARAGDRAALLRLVIIKRRSWANLRKLYYGLVRRRYLRSWAKRRKAKRGRSRRQVYPRHWGVGVYY